MQIVRVTLAWRNLATDPRQQLQLWLDEAIAVEHTEPNAMTLATAGAVDAMPGGFAEGPGGGRLGFIPITRAPRSKWRKTLGQRPVFGPCWDARSGRGRLATALGALRCLLCFPTVPASWAPGFSQSEVALMRYWSSVSGRWRNALGAACARPPHRAAPLVPDSYGFSRGPGNLHQLPLRVVGGSDWRRVLAP